MNNPGGKAGHNGIDDQSADENGPQKNTPTEDLNEQESPLWMPDYHFPPE